MVSAAPTFEDVAGDIAVRLHGACLVAHNLPFDHRMLSNEFERLGTDLGTRVGVDTLSATGSRLTDACTTHGIPFVGAHRALTDAVATAHLFVQIADRCKPGAPLAAPSSHLRCGRVCRREDTAPVHLPDPPLVMYLASRLSHTGVEVAMLQYLEVVGRAVADVHLDREEREFLATLAGQLGLTEAQTAQSHRRFVNDLVAAAVADNEVTDEEYEALVRVASALDVDQAMVDARVHPLRSHALAVMLTAGATVVFTGEHRAYERDELTQMATAMGLEVQTGVSKSTDMVAAADPASNSGKAAKARRYGIPIVDVDDLLRASVGEAMPAHGTGQAALKVITCPDCYSTSAVPATSSATANKRCSECAAIAATTSAAMSDGVPVPPPPPPQGGPGRVPTAGMLAAWRGRSMETLTCGACGGKWERQRVRGRKPVLCKACIRAAQTSASD